MGGDFGREGCEALGILGVLGVRIQASDWPQVWSGGLFTLTWPTNACAYKDARTFFGLKNSLMLSLVRGLV